MNRALVPVAACLFLALAASAEETTPRPERPRSTFRVDFTLRESQDGQKTNERTYTLTVNEGGSGNVRVGSRVPLPAGEKGVQYMDVGLRISCRIREAEPGDVALEADVDVTSFAAPDGLDPKAAPVLQSISQSSSARPALGKPTLLTSVDDVGSKKRIQVEVTVTRAK